MQALFFYQEDEMVLVFPPPYPYDLKFYIEIEEDKSHVLKVHLMPLDWNFDFDSNDASLEFRFNLDGLMNQNLKLLTMQKQFYAVRDVSIASRGYASASLEDTSVLFLPEIGILQKAIEYLLGTHAEDEIYVNLPAVEYSNGKTISTLRVKKSLILNTMLQLLDESGLDKIENLGVLTSRDRVGFLLDVKTYPAISHLFVSRNPENVLQTSNEPLIGYLRRDSVDGPYWSVEDDDGNSLGVVDLADLIDNRWRDRISTSRNNVGEMPLDL